MPHTNDFVVADSGERQVFSTGAQRDSQEEKPRFDLIPPHALRRLAYVYARGAAKYDENNWMKGMPYSRILASLERHLQDFKEGKGDEDHLAQVVWNGIALIQYQELPQFYGHLDDLVDYNAKTLAEALHVCPKCMQSKCKCGDGDPALKFLRSHPPIDTTPARWTSGP